MNAVVKARNPDVEINVSQAINISVSDTCGRPRPRPHAVGLMWSALVSRSHTVYLARSASPRSALCGWAHAVGLGLAWSGSPSASCGRPRAVTSLTSLSRAIDLAWPWTRNEGRGRGRTREDKNLPKDQRRDRRKKLGLIFVVIFGL